jgi:AcrR family transcriptional regulator
MAGPKRTRAGRAGLSRGQVLDAAVDLVDRDGVAALSMRRLAAELGVEAMTLYHYLPNKDALLNGVVERVMSAVEPGGVDVRWDRALTDYARSLRATLLRHPGTLQLVATRPAVTPATLRAVERGLTVLCAGGFPLGRALDTLNALTLFVVAHATAEIATAGMNESGAPGSQDYIAGLDEAEFPLLSRAARTSAGTDDADRFEFAVAAMIRGAATVLE